MLVRIQKAVPAGAAALMLAAAGSGALAQDAGLRGTEAPLAQSAPTPLPPLAPNDVAATPLFGAPSDLSGPINYGKPKPKKPKLYRLSKPNPRISPPLPPLVPYPTAPGVRKKATDPAANDPNAPDATTVVPPPTVAVISSLPQPKRPKPDPDPFAPLGIDVGSLRLFPFVETGMGYDTNPNRLSSQVQGSYYNQTEAGLKLQSDWSQNSLTADLRGGYSDYFQYHQADRPDAAATIIGRVDVSRDTQINSETRFNLTTQQPGSPLLAIPSSVFIVNRPLITSYGETLGVTQNFNRLQVSLRGSFDRMTFGDATQSDGTTLLLSTEDYNAFGLQGRVGYELTPGVIPFVQVTGDIRRHDQYFDLYGFARNSDGLAAEIGTKFELTRLLTGEIGVGYSERSYVDPRLPKLAAPTLDGKLIYTATPLTTLTLKTATDFSETPDAYAAGAVSRSVSLEVAQALKRDLTVKVTGTYVNNNYVGEPITENLYSAILGAEYNLTRSIVVRGSFTHERLQSSLPGSDYTANVFLLGLRLQR
ncbi:MAG: outer membrane beta-barrel protein [Beijerinckiaceae bacterium]